MSIRLLGTRLTPCVALLLATVAWAQAPATPLIPADWSRQVVIPVPPARPQAPKIDGHVDYKEWYYASSVSGFIDADTGCETDLPVQLLLCYDDKFVYVGLIIQRPPMNPTPRANFPAGQHPDIWWQDDNFELVVSPGRPEKGVQDYYAFCGNSVGGWCNRRGPLQGSGGDASWPGQWLYKAERAGLETWHAELAIPVAQFAAYEQPGPGAVWLLDVMNQQVTPQKKMVDLGMVWNFGADGYRAPTRARLLFEDEGPIIRPHGLGLLPPVTGKPPQMGLRQVFYNQGRQPYTLQGEAQLYRSPTRHPAGTLDFFGLWDRLRTLRQTGKPLTEAGDAVQAFRSEADLLNELNTRYSFVTARQTKFTVAPGGAGFFSLEQPVASGEYVLAYRFTDTQTGQVVAAQVVPYAILPALDLTLRPYFLRYEKLRVEATLQNMELHEGDQLELALVAGGQTLDQTTLPVGAGTPSVHAYLSTQNLIAQTPATVTARLLGADGRVRTSNSAPIVRPPTPDWFGNQIGRSAVVPPPFTPVRVTGQRQVEVWQRQIALSDEGLPQSLLVRGTELLARPVNLDLGDLRPDWRLRLVSADAREAVFETTGQAEGVKVTVRAAIHYDGTIRYDLTLDPGPTPALVSRLVLFVPMATEWAQLARHASIYTDPARTKARGFAGSVDEWFTKYPRGAVPFTYSCYLGAADRGVEWFAESDRGWSNRDEEQVVSLRRQPEATVLRVAFIDEPTKLREVWRTSFGLTVTPVKDCSSGRAIVKVAEGHPAEEKINRDPQLRASYFEAYHAAGVNEISIYMSDDNHFGSPRLWGGDNERIVRDFAKAVHEQGFRLTPYAGWGVSDNIPDFATFGQEMLAEPLKNIGWGCFLHNPASVFADWWLAGTRYTVEQTGLDGTYLDGLAEPRLLQNELDGFAWTDSQGRPRGTYPIWALRDFMERLYIYTHVEAPHPATIRDHEEQQLYCLQAFCDQRVTGEQYYNRGKTVLEVFSPAEFRAVFMTHPSGVATTALWPGWLNLPVTPNQMQGMLLLHDVPRDVGGGVVRNYAKAVGYGAKTDPWVRLKHIRDAFGGAEFVPYWGETTVATSNPAGLLASAWVDRGQQRALVVLANLGTADWAGTVRFDRTALGLGNGVAPVDAMFDQQLPQNADGSVPLRLGGQQYRLVIFGDRVALPDRPVLDDTRP